MKHFLYLAVLLTLLSSCRKDANSYCGVDNPLIDIKWLRDIVQADTLVHPSFKLKIYKVTDYATEGFMIKQDYGNSFETYIEYRTCDNVTWCKFGGVANTQCTHFNTTYLQLIYDH